VLIDSRLDTIDRILMGRLPRAERVDIVREVESQIFELLGQRHNDELDREDVLTVLRRLDPPEAYLPDESGSEPSPRRGVTSTRAGELRRGSNAWIGMASGIIGIIMCIILVMLFPAIELLSALGLSSGFFVIWFGFTLVSFVGGIIGVVFAGKAGVKGGWAVAGLVTNIIALLLSLVAGAFGLLEL
jgi:hypothetical protein